jgi:alkylhydroperoxidase/carboxymuconolactone decarboxylase family protein YurZ
MGEALENRVRALTRRLLRSGLGALEQEISEVVMIAAALRAGAAVTHGTHAIKGT